MKDTLAAALMQIGGGSAFALMVPVLAGFIAFSIADRPGLTPGLSAVCWRLAAAPALSAGSSLVSLPVMWRKHQHEAETAAEYGSPEANPDHSAGLQPDRGFGNDLSDR
ncbi:PTS system, fructose-specific IIB component / PTS system, fructose-specific IIC component [Klebsiella pneumoniae IS39]|nr:PTS system, fructose-specific IIB component / PTS system, fructose-specific IIC component [Klebsiella pneumoniae IS39]